MTFVEATILNQEFFELSNTKCVNIVNKYVEAIPDDSLCVLEKTDNFLETEHIENKSGQLYAFSSEAKERILELLDSEETWVYENVHKLLTVLNYEKCAVRLVVSIDVLMHSKLTAYVGALKERRNDLSAFRSLILIHTLRWLRFTNDVNNSNVIFSPGVRLHQVLYQYPIFDEIVYQNDSLVKALFYKDEYFEDDIQLRTIIRISQSLFQRGGVKAVNYLSNLYELIKESSLLQSILSSFKGVWSDQHYYLFKWLHAVDPELVQNVEKSPQYSDLKISSLLDTGLDEKQLYSHFFKKKNINLGPLTIYPHLDKAQFLGWAETKSVTNIENSVLLEKIEHNVCLLNKHLFNKASLTGMAPVLKKVAKYGFESAHAYLFDYFYRKLSSAKTVHNFNEYSDLQKLAFIAVNVNKILNISADPYAVIEKPDTYVKGWFDLAKLLSNVHRWHLMSFRFDKKEPKFENFLDNYNLSYVPSRDELSRDSYFGVSCIYNPIDERGGFSLNTYVGLCKEFKVHPWKSTGTDRANQAAALSLAYLFGSDIEAAKALVRQKIEESSAKDKTAPRVLKKALHDSGQFQIPHVPAQDIRYWRPYFIRNEKIRMYADYVLKFDRPDVWMSDAEVIRKVYATLIPGLPENLGDHAVHIIEHGWRKSVIEEFVSILPKAKKESLIPDIEFKHEGVTVQHLKPGDPTALYIGELSGCCQHINYGAGDGAAQQSFTQPWCSVLTVESENGSLLAQAFIWLSKKGDTVVIDSLESIHGVTSDVIKNKVFPAVHTWVVKMTELGYNVVLSDTYYGITAGLKRYLHRSGQLKKEAKSALRVTPWARLSYTDFHGDGVLYYANE